LREGEKEGRERERERQRHKETERGEIEITYKTTRNTDQHFLLLFTLFEINFDFNLI
jgi:hypothetical protein